MLLLSKSPALPMEDAVLLPPLWESQIFRLEGKKDLLPGLSPSARTGSQTKGRDQWWNPAIAPTQFLEKQLFPWAQPRGRKKQVARPIILKEASPWCPDDCV